MKWCTKCWYPDTKPDLFFDEFGVCSACKAFEARASIDWKDREAQFIRIIDNVKAKKATYDCIVPVSGGKDSTYQVIKAKHYGLNVLAVNATTDHLSQLGRANLDNIASLGVDLIEVNTGRQTRNRIAKYCLEKVGDISWAEHVTIFTVPVHMAIKFNVPLILWGENAQNEYGGPKKAQQATKLDNRWLQEFGGLNGLRVRDLIDRNVATNQELYFYKYPSLDNIDLAGVYLGQFFPWDGLENAIIAHQNGFQWSKKPVEGVGYNYENLDNHQTGIHDYFKFLKFGFGRCTDLVGNHIRRGRLTRQDGKQLVLSFDGRYPSTYLGKSLEEILANIKLTIPGFIHVCNKFANKDLFTTSENEPPKPIFKRELINA